MRDSHAGKKAGNRNLFWKGSHVELSIHLFQSIYFKYVQTTKGNHTKGRMSDDIASVNIESQ